VFPSSKDAGNLSYSDLGTALGAIGTELYTVKVLGITAWNITGPATTSNSIQLAIGENALLSGASNLIGEDYGNSARLAGVKINIPDLLSTTKTTGGLVFAQVTAPLAGSAVQNFCVDVDVMMQM